MFRSNLLLSTVAPADMKRVSIQRSNEVAIAYSASNVMTTDIARGNPISRIFCRLTGNLVVASAAASALKLGGGLGLIRTLELRRNGDEVLFSLPGWMLPYLHRMYNNVDPYSSAPALTTGTNAFEYTFEIPVDPGNRMALLDASASNSLRLAVTWGSASDAATAGSGGTVSVTSVQLDVRTIALAGIDPGKQGGVRFPYLKHVVQSAEISVTAAQAEKVFNLEKNRAHTAFPLFTVSDGALVNTILNSAAIRVGNNTIQKAYANDMRAENLTEFNLGSRWTGVYVLDTAEADYVDTLLSIEGTLPFDLLLDVAHPGTTDSVHVLLDYFVRP